MKKSDFEKNAPYAPPFPHGDPGFLQGGQQFHIPKDSGAFDRPGTYEERRSEQQGNARVHQNYFSLTDVISGEKCSVPSRASIVETRAGNVVTYQERVREPHPFEHRDEQRVVSTTTINSAGDLTRGYPASGSRDALFGNSEQRMVGHLNSNNVTLETRVNGHVIDTRVGQSGSLNQVKDFHNDVSRSKSNNSGCKPS